MMSSQPAAEIVAVAVIVSGPSMAIVFPIVQSTDFPLIAESVPAVTVQATVKSFGSLTDSFTIPFGAGVPVISIAAIAGHDVIIVSDPVPESVPGMSGVLEHAASGKRKRRRFMRPVYPFACPSPPVQSGMYPLFFAASSNAVSAAK